MANWNGVYENPNSTGISTGMNGSNTLNDTTANFPTLNNQHVKITAGTGIGQERQIANNYVTQITIWGSWDIIPDDTSQYEIVLRLQDGDHIVAATYLYPGVISELEDNATIYVDGNYLFTIGDVAEVRWNKSKDTMVTFEANNRNVQGKYGFWGGILFKDFATGIVKLSYLCIRDANVALHVEPSVALGDGSDVHHILVEECSNYPFAMYNSPLLQNTTIKNVLVINSTGQNYYTNKENPYDLTFEHFWVDGGIGWYGSTSSRIQTFKDSVVFGVISQPSTINNVDKKIYIIDNYLQTHDTKGVYIIYPGAGEKGSIHSNRNISKLGYDLINNSEEVDLKMYSRHNDYSPCGKKQYTALANWGNVAETFTSHSDFIAGRKNAIANNVDVTELVTSNHNPPMYEGLSSARTNAKLTPNKLFELDNVRESNLTANSIKVRFDCRNSDIGTIIDQDSASGQKILYVANTSEFDMKETIEIGFKTVRQETGIIDSIQSGISITLKENLIYTHIQIDADTVKKRLRHIILGYAQYGFSADALSMSTHLPRVECWGHLYCGFKPECKKDEDYEWKHTDIEINVITLRSATKYYYQLYGMTPFGEDLTEPFIRHFTTPTSVAYTDPEEVNVREGTSYKFGNVDKTGVLDLPTIADVRKNVVFDNTTKSGISDHALEVDVRESIKYDNNTKTGELVIGITVSGIYEYFTDGNREDVFKADLTGIEQDVTTSGIYNYFTDGNREDVFKANISGLAPANEYDTALSEIQSDILRDLGLSQENYYLDQMTYATYQGAKLLTGGRIRVYSDAVSVGTDSNIIATYIITASWTNDKLQTYKVVKQ